MKSSWNEQEANACNNDLLQLRVYTSRLLGKEDSLVLHGGGNTSVKITTPNFFGEEEDLLYVKGSGWDLATIEKEGFAPVKMETLLKMAELEELSDSNMVIQQRAAMTNPNAPNPSVEAILHAIIPFTFVDHTHADAVVTVTNTENGEERIKEIYGDRVLILPYVMPGFILAKKVAEMIQGVDWSKLEGIVLLNHGIFSFHNDAKTSYETMIKLVNEAEQYLEAKGSLSSVAKSEMDDLDLIQLAKIRKEVSSLKGNAMIVKLNSNEENVGFSKLENVTTIATQGPLTPDHVIRTKRVPIIFQDKIEEQVQQYTKDYLEYFQSNTDGNLTCLDQAPRWGVWQGKGTLAFGNNIKDSNIIEDITGHTIQGIQWAEKLGGWQALPAKDIFDVEYWELEQAKLKKGGSKPELQGKVALVTGAASGIGKACADDLLEKGACVVALDINPQVSELFNSANAIGVACDVTNSKELKNGVDTAVRAFGGLDILVSNAGMFPSSMGIDSMQKSAWQKSLDLNLSSHQELLTFSAPYLAEGIEPAVVIIASKNVPAPGPGASAYSVAKAGLTQLARIAALEWAEKRIRVNVLHPNAVFDTAIWTQEVLETRAKRYGLTVEEYKTSNLLKTEVTSKDVARLCSAMAGTLFSKTTGCQLPVDGGTERII